MLADRTDRTWSLVDRSEICRNRKIRGQSGAVLINVHGHSPFDDPQLDDTLTRTLQGTHAVLHRMDYLVSVGQDRCRLSIQ